MTDTNSLSHSKWNCKYHIVFSPKLLCLNQRISSSKILNLFSVKLNSVKNRAYVDSSFKVSNVAV